MFRYHETLENMLSFILAYGDGEYKKKIKFAGSYSSLALLFTGWGKVMTIRGSFEPHIWPVIQIESY